MLDLVVSLYLESHGIEGCKYTPGARNERWVEVVGERFGGWGIWE